MVKTSIIVPVYNTAPYLRECFDSIFNQTQKEIEVIAINDGSTDSSLSILEEIKTEHPELVIFSQENQGLGAARNKGMELATGEFIYFIDSDDCLVSIAMEICYHYAKTNNVDIVMFDAEVFGEMEIVKNKKNAYNRTGIIKEQYIVMSGEEYAQKYWLVSFCPSAWLIYTSAEFLKTYCYNFPPRIYYEDNEFHCRVIPSAKLIYLPRMLYRRRYRENSIMTSGFDMRHAKDFLKMIQLIEKQEHSESIRDIINKVLRKRLALLLQLCEKNNLLVDLKFVEDFYLTAQRIYREGAEQIDQYQDINVMFHLCSALGYEAISVKLRKKLLENFCELNPWVKENSCIGIYGTGKKSEEFLYEYREIIEKKKLNLFFIESNVKSGEKKYKDFDVFHINDIGDMRLDCIIITSIKYEQEMRETIQKQYGDKFKVLVWRSGMRLEE